MPTRNYANAAVPVAINAGVNAAATSLAVSSLVGYPSVPFGGVLDRGDDALRELVLVTAISGSGPYTLTVTRGHGGTTATTHASGAILEHVTSAVDFTEFQSRLDEREQYARSFMFGVH